MSTATLADPLPYLRDAARRSSGLREYEVTFCRQERLGLIPSLRPAEWMDAYFRAEPLSVKFGAVGQSSARSEASIAFKRFTAPV